MALTLLLAALAGSNALVTANAQDSGQRAEPPPRSSSPPRHLPRWFDPLGPQRPRRTDQPLRAENITDEEVREIRRVMLDYFPGAILNISGVTTGCPCEDGPACEHQVWVVANQDDRSTGILLSRLDGAWTVGPVQAWWLEMLALYEDLRIAREIGDREHRWQRFSALTKLQSLLEESAPRCELEDGSS